MAVELEKLQKKIEKIESQKNEELFALVEILSNLSFFGELKQAKCCHAKEGQCSYFTLKENAKNKIPIVTNCRIKNCSIPTNHCHIELSNITCSLCQKES